uniref:Uncharacterized protein n=1 Tax=Arundo donax TaxID=35708 RepID=A0A0A9HDW7_ARUDO
MKKLKLEGTTKLSKTHFSKRPTEVSNLNKTLQKLQVSFGQQQIVNTTIS